MDLFDLYATLTLDTAGFEQGLLAAEGKVRSFSQRLGKSFTAASVSSGQSLQGALNSVTTLAAGAEAASHRMGGVFDSLTTHLTPANAVLTRLSTAFASLGGSLQSAVRATSMGAESLAGVFAALNQRAAPLLNLMTQLEPRLQSMARAGETLAEALVASVVAGDETARSFQSLTGVFPELRSAGETFAAQWDRQTQAVLAAAVGVVQYLATLPGRAAALWNAITGTNAGAVATLGRQLAQLQQLSAQYFSAISALAQRHMTATSDSVASALTAMNGSFSGSMAGAQATVSAAMAAISGAVSTNLNAAGGTVATVFSGIQSGIAARMSAARSAVAAAVDAIRAKMNFSWSLPRLALPHLSVSGSFSLSPPSVPRFSVSWYKKAMDQAMLLTRPTIFGAMDGQLLGAGEAGAEVVSGADTLMGMIRQAAAPDQEVLSLLRRIAASLNQSAAPVTLTLDGQRLGEAMFPSLRAYAAAKGTPIVR